MNNISSSDRQQQLKNPENNNSNISQNSNSNQRREATATPKKDRGISPIRTPVQATSPLNQSRAKTSTTPSKIREASPFDNKFYNRIYEKDEKDRFREEMKQNEIQELAETKKMSQNSYRILCKQLEERLAQAISVLDIDQTKQLTFQALGRLLTQFNVIQTIQYNEECEHIFYVKDSHIAQHRDEEIEFHEQLWMVLGNFGNSGESVSADFTFTILRVLMDPASLKSDQLESLLLHYFEKQYADFSARRQHLLSQPIDPNSYPPWTIKQFVMKYRKLTVTNISKQSLGNIKDKDKIRNESILDQSFPFKPTINDRSRILDDLNRSRLTQNVDNLLFSKDNSQIANDRSAISNADRVELMKQKQEIHQNWLDEQKNLTRIEEMKACTFHPKINQPHSKSPNRSQSQKSFDTLDSQASEHVFNRLYSQRNLTVPAKEEEEKQRRALEKEQEQLKECTFQPALTPYSPSRSKSPNGFDKNVGRMRMGYQKQLEHQQKLEYKPAGEGLDKKKKQPFNPPEMLNRSEIKHKPFVVLDINICAGRSGRIGICEGDNPVTLARNFAKTFQLDQEMEETVFEIVSQQIESYNQKKEQKRSLAQSASMKSIKQSSTTAPPPTMLKDANRFPSATQLINQRPPAGRHYQTDQKQYQNANNIDYDEDDDPAQYSYASY